MSQSFFSTISIDVYAAFLSSETWKQSDNNFWDRRFSSVAIFPLKFLRVTNKGDLESTLVYLIGHATRSALKSGIIRDRRKLAALRHLKDL